MTHLQSRRAFHFPHVLQGCLLKTQTSAADPPHLPPPPAGAPPPSRSPLPEVGSRRLPARPGHRDLVSGQLPDTRTGARSNSSQNLKHPPNAPTPPPQVNRCLPTPWLLPLPLPSSSFSCSAASPSPPPSFRSHRRRSSSSSPPTPPTVIGLPPPSPISKLTRAVSQISAPVSCRSGCPARRVPALGSRVWRDGGGPVPEDGLVRVPREERVNQLQLRRLVPPVPHHTPVSAPSS
jgi:hypothetical protein